MNEYRVRGGNKIKGEISINGGKNAILPILAATVLNKGVSIIHNAPFITDLFITIKILESVGCKTKWENDVLIIDSKYADCYEAPEDLVREMRSSIIFLGSILGRFKKVKISHPGGCELGARPIDLHLKALKDMGVQIKEEHGFIFCEVDNNIKGRKINLDFPSVGATENIMLTAVLAEGVTTIGNAAKEPEIVDLQKFLNGMGAKVKGAGTDTIYIEGVKNLHDVTHVVMPDRIVAGTFLIAAAISKGEIYVKNVAPQDLEPILGKLSDTACQIKTYEKTVYLKAPEKIRPVDIRTHPHPGLPTDIQPQFMSLLTLAGGTSIIIETVFESRFKHAGELMRMGADISIDGRIAITKGVETLKGAKIEAKDLRGGAALILAGLAAEGETVIENAKYVQRGYEQLEKTLGGLGADIEFVK